MIAAARIALMVFALIFAPAQAAAQDQIRPTLRSEIIAETETLRLTDFFEPAGDFGDTVVAYAPQPGRRAVFDANWLARLAQRFRLDWRPSSRKDQTVVERLSTVITASEIIDALQDELAAHGFDEHHDISITNPQMQIHIPADQPATVSIVELVTDARANRLTAIVAAPAGDPHAKRFKIRGQLHPVVEIPVPAHPLRPGHVIQAEDITWVQMRRAQLRNNMLSDPDGLIGKTARVPLRAGHAVRTTEVHTPALVKKGNNVSMIFRTDVMFLSAAGIALESGSRDDVIAVRNNQSGTVIEATVIGPDRVEAHLAGVHVTGGR